MPGAEGNCPISAVLSSFCNTCMTAKSIFAVIIFDNLLTFLHILLDAYVQFEEAVRV